MSRIRTAVHDWQDTTGWLFDHPQCRHTAAAAFENSPTCLVSEGFSGKKGLTPTLSDSPVINSWIVALLINSVQKPKSQLGIPSVASASKDNNDARSSVPASGQAHRLRLPRAAVREDTHPGRGGRRRVGSSPSCLFSTAAAAASFHLSRPDDNLVA